MAYGRAPTNALDAALDFDCDGWTNLQEYHAGTDPLRFDGLRLTAAQFDPQGRFELIIRGALGKTYTLEASTNLLQWMPMTTFLCRYPDQKVQTEFTRTTAQTFFRLRSDINAPSPLLTLLNGPSLPANPPFLQIMAPPGGHYSLQVSMNLSNWLEITNYFGRSCTIVFPDATWSGQDRRFYRVLAQ